MLIIFHYYLHFKEEFIESSKISFLKNIYIRKIFLLSSFVSLFRQIGDFVHDILCSVFTCCDNMSLLCVSRSSVAILFHSLVTSFLLLTYGRFDFTFSFYVAYVEKLGKQRRVRRFRIRGMEGISPGDRRRFPSGQPCCASVSAEPTDL